MANNKRKGRTRIKLDARKIALAKQLILREATTTVIANELNISRTFAWRLRKSLVNGVSLHERVIDPPDDDEEAEVNDLQDGQIPVNGESSNIENRNENRLKHQPIIEHIKREQATTEEEDEEEEDEVEEERDNVTHNRDNNHESENESQDHNQSHHPTKHSQQQLDDERQAHHIPQQPTLIFQEGLSVATSVIQRTNELKLNNAQQQEQILTTATTNAILEQQLHNKISVVQQQRLMEVNNKNAHLENNNDTATDNDTDSDTEDANTNHPYHHQQRQRQQILEQQQRQIQHQETETVNSHAQQQLLHHQQQQPPQLLYIQQKLSATNFKDPQDDAEPTLDQSANGSKVPQINQMSSVVTAAM